MDILNKILVHSSTSKRIFNYNILCINVIDSNIEISTYIDSDNIDYNEMFNINGEDVNPELVGKKLNKVSGSIYTLDVFRNHIRFSDMSFFGVFSSYVAPCWIDINRDTRSNWAVPAFLDRGCDMGILFPDTECTLQECVIIAPYPKENELYVVSNLEVMNADGIKELDDSIPVVTINGSDNIEKNSISEYSITTAPNKIGLFSLLDYRVSLDNGISFRRKFRVYTGESRTFKVDTTNLESNDIITLKILIDGYGTVATKRITVN